jgi:hypothetical protein
MLTLLLNLLVPLLSNIPATNGLTAPDNVGKLPALGWNSWNAYGCDISEANFLDAAQKLVDLGLKVSNTLFVAILPFHSLTNILRMPAMNMSISMIATHRRSATSPLTR